MSDNKEIPDVIFTEKDCDKWSVIEQTWAIPNNRTRYISYTKTSTANQMVVDALEEVKTNCFTDMTVMDGGYLHATDLAQVIHKIIQKHKGE